MPDPVIEFRHVSFRYPAQPKAVLKDLHLSVGKGEIYGFLGPNGAGKSTVFRILVGLREATSGEALVEGNRTFVGDRDIYHRIGYMLDVGEAFDDCTVENLLRFLGRCHGMTEKVIQDRITALLKRFHLEELHLAPVLSSGLSAADLQSPLSALMTLSLVDAAQVFQLVDDLGSTLELTPRPPSSYSRQIQVLNEVARRTRPLNPPTAPPA